MTTPTMRFTVPATAEDRVRQMIAATNARAAVHGLAAYSVEASAPILEDYEDFDGRVIGQRYMIEITVSGAVPRHQGWSVVARLDHDEEGETITSLFPCLPEETAAAARGYRAVENLCHGCKIARHRTATYLARHQDTGEWRQLGTTCVEPYTGLPIKGLLALWRLGQLKDADWDEERDGEAYPSDLRVRVLDVLRVTAAVVASEGRYRSRAEEWKGAVPTADTVEAYFFDRRASAEFKAFIDADHEAPQTAAAVRAWAIEGYGHLSDYRHKVGQLAKPETVSPRHLPVLVSAIAGWHRDQSKATAEAAARSSKPQGTVGERINFPATVTAAIELESRTYGYKTQPRTLIKFQDAEGNVYVWFSSTTRVPDNGDEVAVTGTVKKHDTYGETAQTVLTRCRITEREPVAA